jgi:hypothetical protein
LRALRVNFYVDLSLQIFYKIFYMKCGASSILALFILSFSAFAQEEGRFRAPRAIPVDEFPSSKSPEIRKAIPVNPPGKKSVLEIPVSKGLAAPEAPLAPATVPPASTLPPPPQLKAEDIVGPSSRAEAARLLLENPSDVAALAKGLEEKLITQAQALAVTAKVVPHEIEATKSELYPFQKARIDIFMADSDLHDIEEEFAILSLDDQVRAIGLVSTGKDSTPTPAQLWEVYGFDKNRESYTFDSSPMPYALMLSSVGNKFYSETAMHGTFGYGYGSFGQNRSHGCIRLITESEVYKRDADKAAKWPAQGLHRIFWDLLNPQNYKHADHLENFIYGSWYPESQEARGYIRELRYKMTVRTHSPRSLKKIPGWKSLFEALYSPALIQEGIYRGKRGGRGYKQFYPDYDGAKVMLSRTILRELYEAERALYKTPSYLRTEEPEELQYNRRHLDWLKRLP